jgi:hypothetical protein
MSMSFRVFGLPVRRSVVREQRLPGAAVAQEAETGAVLTLPVGSARTCHRRITWGSAGAPQTSSVEPNGGTYAAWCGWGAGGVVRAGRADGRAA